MTPTRRAFVAAGLALPFLPRRATAVDVDVAVVGAGAAGIAAAQAVRAAGRTVTVLEARDRVGGRAYTDTTLGHAFDAGARYIHWAERNPWKTIADELGVRLLTEGWGGPSVVYADGRRLSDEERMNRRSGFGRIWSRLPAPGGPDRSFAEIARDGPREIVEAAAGLTRFTFGEEPERVSVADYHQLWSGDDYVVEDGYGTLVTRSGAGLPIRLGTPVTAIVWGGSGIRVETPRGTLRAARLILTVPVGVLQAGGIRFTPALPAPFRDALAGLGMGAYTKIVLRFDRERAGPVSARDLIEVGGDGRAISYEVPESGAPLIMAVLGGDFARHLTQAGEDAAIAFARERIAHMLGTAVADTITGGRLAGWWTDPWARGSYSIARPGRLSARDALREPIGGGIFYAGEASAGGGAMTVGGATLEGRRAAQAALRGLA